MSGWQDIASAPKDGRKIYVLSKPDTLDIETEIIVRPAEPSIAWWNPEGDSWVDDNGDINGDAHHLEVTGSWFTLCGGWLQPNEVSHWRPFQPNEIGARIALLRGERGMTQQQLALECETKQPAICRLETGEHLMSLSTLARIAQALRCDLRVTLEPLSAPPTGSEA